MTRVPLTVALLSAAPALALTPVPACEGTYESGMQVGEPWWLGDQGGSGYTVESYYDSLADGPRPSLDALAGFSGVRVVECASGRFLTIPFETPNDVTVALSATEFLRPTLQAGRSPDFASVQRAAEALYRDVGVLRETAETCGCSAAFPDWRPAGLTPYEERPDLG